MDIELKPHIEQPLHEPEELKCFALHGIQLQQLPVVGQVAHVIIANWFFDQLQIESTKYIQFYLYQVYQTTYRCAARQGDVLQVATSPYPAAVAETVDQSISS